MKPKRKSGCRNHDSHPGVLIPSSKATGAKSFGNEISCISRLLCTNEKFFELYIIVKQGNLGKELIPH